MHSASFISDDTLLSRMRDILAAVRKPTPAERSSSESSTNQTAAPFAPAPEPVWQGQWRTIRYL